MATYVADHESLLTQWRYIYVVLLGTRFLRVWPKKVFFHEFLWFWQFFHKFLLFFTNLSLVSSNLWKIGEIREKLSKSKKFVKKTPFWVKRGEILVPNNPTSSKISKISQISENLRKSQKSQIIEKIQKTEYALKPVRAEAASVNVHGRIRTRDLTVCNQVLYRWATWTVCVSVSYTHLTLPTKA